jgi:hypothetical protein
MQGRKTGGRKAGTKNKSTVEHEQRLLDALRARTARLAPQVWAKDALEDLVPEAVELTRAIKGVVADLHKAAQAELQIGGVTKNLGRLKDWMTLLKDAEVAASLIMSRAAEFQSPKLSRVAVGIGMISSCHNLNPNGAEDKLVLVGDRNAASRAYQQLVKEIR